MLGNASCVISFRHFGKEIIASKLPIESKSDELVDQLHDRIYQKFIEPFDAVDNGVNQYPKEIEPAYARPYDIFAQIDDLNPNWNESEVNPNVKHIFRLMLIVFPGKIRRGR